MALLKVSSRSNPNAVAGAFAGVVREKGRVEVQVVGAGALNQAVKAVAIARSMVSAQGIDLICVPSFVEIEIEGQPRTAVQLLVEPRVVVDPSTAVDAQLTAPVEDLAVENTAGDLRITTEASPSGDASAVVAPVAPRTTL